MQADASNTIDIFLCGDVMTGRGIEQILPHPSNPTLHESCASDARDYVALAEEAHGTIPRSVGDKYIWGDALAEMARADVRIINLETSITRANDHWPDKGIHYRMHPRNIGCLTAAGIDACSLANNHTLDWGFAGLMETLQTLDNADIAHAGAGRHPDEAAAPAVAKIPGKGRVLLFSYGSITSGIPEEWAATQDHSGLNLLNDLSEETAGHAATRLREIKQAGDVAIASIHWGINWGYEIPEEEISVAHRLIDEGFDIIHGHSSHHMKAVEIYHNRLILYGCGDFLTDYEGITGYETYRGDLSLMYLVTIDLRGPGLVTLRLVPMQMRRFQLHHASFTDAQWICSLLNKLGEAFGTQFEQRDHNSIYLTSGSVS
jgi:poly-gamma-glutamate capsule biosynthesis protein CapA/YwtB (metallophosphatase superfamily)